MIFPCLVDKRYCKTPITVRVGKPTINEDGEEETAAVINGFCNYQECSKVKFNGEKQGVTVTGIAYFVGDIAPAIKTISGGTVLLLGAERDIYQGTKARNPDGTVNYTLLEVI